MAEPEPETNGEPIISSGSDEVDNDGNMELFGNQTPHAEPQHDHATTFGIWWDLHRYGLGAVFLLICIYAVRSTIIMSCRKHGTISSTKPFLTFINILVVIMCLLRAVYLCVNPYNQVGFFPVVVNNILFNIPFPCMTTCFAMILWVFREVGQVRLSVRSRSRNLRALFVIAVTHLGSVIIIGAIIEFTGNRILLIVMCHGFFVLWEMFLCFSAVLLMCRISKAVRKTGKTLVSISTKGHSTALRSNSNDVNMNISMDKSTNAPIHITDKTLTNELSFGSKNYDKIKLCQTSASEPHNIDANYDDCGEVNVEIVETPCQGQVTDLDPALWNFKPNVGQTITDEALSDESHNSLGFQHAGSIKFTNDLTSPCPVQNIQAKMLKVTQNILSCAKLPRDSNNPDDKIIINDTDKLSTVSAATSENMENDNHSSQSSHLQQTVSSLDSRLEENEIPRESSCKVSPDQTRNKAKPKASTSPTRRKHPGTSTPQVRSTFSDVARRARLTRKVTRITVVTTVTGCMACILDLLFILSVFPGTNVFQGSEYWIFIFWTCFRVTEIAMACVILYFVAQPMPKSKTQSQSTIK